MKTNWYDNGNKLYEGEFANGYEQGLITEWYSNGRMKFEVLSLGGKRLSGTFWMPNGKICPSSSLTEGNGVVVKYNDTGSEISKIKYVDGIGVEIK